jgi:hypothetical protein
MEKINLESGDLGPDFSKENYEEKYDLISDEEDDFYEEEDDDWDYDEYENQRYREPLEDLPTELIDTINLKEELEDQDIENIYIWYAEAMQRRNRLALNYSDFIYHFFEMGSWESTVSYGNLEKGYVFGFYKNEIFIPTHFAPKTMKSGYELFKELAENKSLPVATAVTTDLAETLMKMKGWHRLKSKFLSYFSSEIKEKVIVHNSAKGIRIKLISLVKEFWNETKRLKS